MFPRQTNPSLLHRLHYILQHALSSKESTEGSFILWLCWRYNVHYNLAESAES